MKNIVILGAGFGGLRAAMDISRKLTELKLLDKYRVMLVDRNDCHLYTPFLYLLAAASEELPRSTCTYDTSSLMKGSSVRFMQSEVASLDLMNGDVHLKTGEEIRADFLVIAMGSETNYFGIPGLKEHAQELKTVQSALRVRETLKQAFAKGGDVKIVAGGAGPNGIELATELRLWANKEEKKNQNLRVSISIVEALPTVLMGMDPRVQKSAAKRLADLGIELKLNAKIVSVSEKEIAIDGGAKIPFDVFVWTGGIKTPDAVTQLPIQKEPHGKPVPQPSLACLPGTPDLKLGPMVYGIGDSVCFVNPKTQRPVPAVAHIAILEGGIAAHNLIEQIKTAEIPGYKPQLTSYVPKEYPYIIVAGGSWAVAKLGPFVFSGLLGWTFEKLVELKYLSSIMPFMSALKKSLFG